MRKVVLTIALVLLCSGIAAAQHGTAEPDYYPTGFHGDTWSGDVTAANEDTREFTLTYTKGDKSETFVGVLPAGYTVKMKDGRDYVVKVTELIGMRLKAYYITRTTKDATGAKGKTYEVFKIKFIPKKN